MIRNVHETKISGVKTAELLRFDDHRGSFKKVYQKSKLDNFVPDFDVYECYVTRSKAGVLRGMHFQIPPDDHTKIVICLKGRVLDVVLDLRKSEDYGCFYQVELNETGANTIMVPRGVAHGFFAYEDAELLYLVSSEHSPKNDLGIHWDSFGFNWPTRQPIVSFRDMSHQTFKDFNLNL